MLFALQSTLRNLAKRPGFFAATVVLIGLGVAAATTAFTLVQTLFYKPRQGITDARTLYNVHPVANKDGELGSWSYPDYLALRAQTHELSGLAAFTGLEAGLAHDNRSRRVQMQLVSGNFFAVVGTRPARGRFFLPDEDAAIGQHPVAVISHRLWREQFAGNPAIVGQSVRLNTQDFAIVGVAEPGFHSTFVGFDFDVWVPLAMARVSGLEGDLTRPAANWIEFIGRVAPGHHATAAQTEFAALATQLMADRPAAGRDFHVELRPSRPIDDSLRSTALGFAGALSVIAGLVLVIACLNVSSLLLTRAEERRRENAVRLALGCSRRQLIGEWLRESLVIFACGGLAGLLLAQWVADLSLFSRPSTFFPLAFSFRLDATAFVFSFGIAVLAGLATGLVPALRAAQGDLVHDLKAGGAHGATQSHGLRNGLVVAQLALSIVPLVAAGLFIRTLNHSSRLAPGFEPAGLLTTQLNLAQLGDPTGRRNGDAGRRLLARAQSLPGVTSAALASRMPLGIGSLHSSFQFHQLTNPPPPNGFALNLTYAGVGYFETLRVPLVAGRAFNAADEAAGASPVAIINETAVRRFFGDEDALDHEMSNGLTTYRIIGVVRDVKYSRLWEDPALQVYFPLSPTLRPRVQLIVRTDGNPAALAPMLQHALQSVEPELPLPAPLAGSEHVAITLLPQKIGAQIAAVLGGICLLLAGIGLYSVLALGAARQTREFGIRTALGAQPSQLVALVARRVTSLVTLGLLTGGLLAAGVGTVLGSFLHGVSVLDPFTYLAVAGTLTIIAFLAAWLPARRATKIDPLIALRTE